MFKDPSLIKHFAIKHIERNQMDKMYTMLPLVTNIILQFWFKWETSMLCHISILSFTPYSAISN